MGYKSQFSSNCISRKRFFRFTTILLLPVLCLVSCKPDIETFEENGNIYIKKENVIDQLTFSSNRDYSPILSANKKFIAFLRDTIPSVYKFDDGQLQNNTLWLHDILTDKTKLLVSSKIPVESPPHNTLADLQNLHFSPNSQHVYFHSFAWIKSRSIHRVNIKTGEESFFIDGDIYSFIPKGIFKGYLIISRHKYYDFDVGGSYDHFYLVTPAGKEVIKVGRDYETTNISFQILKYSYFILGFLFVALFFIWKDSKQREMNFFLWGIGVLISPLIVLPFYFIVRKSKFHSDKKNNTKLSTPENFFFLLFVIQMSLVSGFIFSFLFNQLEIIGYVFAVYMVFFLFYLGRYVVENGAFLNIFWKIIFVLIIPLLILLDSVLLKEFSWYHYFFASAFYSVFTFGYIFKKLPKNEKKEKRKIINIKNSDVMIKKIFAIFLVTVSTAAIIFGLVYFISDLDYYLRYLEELLLGFLVFIFLPVIIILYVYWTNFGKPVSVNYDDNKSKIKEIELENKVIELKIKQKELLGKLDMNEATTNI